MGGDMATLINSIREKILPLPDETVIASGHGPTTTIADEKRFNPFL
jgi:glyoxylase-like metal-dependent hydrolase (beta-lactamase superfamily II)